MHLMYTLDADGKRLYTLKKVARDQVTKSAHPARFSPDDKWSRQRVTLKRRFGLLLTQQQQQSASQPPSPFSTIALGCVLLLYFWIGAFADPRACDEQRNRIRDADGASALSDGEREREK